MSGLLASVCSVAEAELALQCCADIIDCKNPRQGALGALAPELICDVVDRVDGLRPVSATTGDLIGRPKRLRRAVQTVADCGVDYIKFGVFDIDQAETSLQAVGDLSAAHDLIAVCFADRFDPTALLPRLTDSGCHGVMLDTADKASGSLTELWSIERLEGFVSQAVDHGLLCGLAGKLQIADIPPLLGVGADYLGFRSALCSGDRRTGLDRGAVMRVRNALPYGRRVTTPIPYPARALH